MKEKRLPRARTRQPRNGSGGLVSRGGYSGCLTAQLPEPREHGFRNHVRRHFRECASVRYRGEGRPIPNGGGQHAAVSALAFREDEIEARGVVRNGRGLARQDKGGGRLVVTRDVGQRIEEV